MTNVLKINYITSVLKWEAMTLKCVDGCQGVRFTVANVIWLVLSCFLVDFNQLESRKKDEFFFIKPISFTYSFLCFSVWYRDQINPVWEHKHFIPKSLNFLHYETKEKRHDLHDNCRAWLVCTLLELNNKSSYLPEGIIEEFGWTFLQNPVKPVCRRLKHWKVLQGTAERVQTWRFPSVCLI